MLNASEEDFNLAVETIINMGLYEPYLVIFVRQLALVRRSEFINRLNQQKKDVNAKVFAGVHMKVLEYFKEISKKNPPQNFRDCFEYYISTDVLKLHTPFLDPNNSFIKSIDVKLNW